MLLSQLAYFEALAREEHFGRAAESCYVSTSTLSEAIRKLEAEVGFPLVNRGKSTYRGLTGEGRLVLDYARRINADQRSLTQDLAYRRGHLDVTVRFGAIPSAADRAAELLGRLVDANPSVRVDLVADLTSEDIVSRVLNHELDAGVIHPGAARGHTRVGQQGAVRLTALGSVHFSVVGRRATMDRFDGHVTGADLEHLPVALLGRNMLAREGFDRAMEDAGASVTPAVETTSVGSLRALAATGNWVAVVPSSGAESGDLVSLPLTAPKVDLDVALVRLDTRPRSMLIGALDEAARA
ncbi:LysR family transcriptional regulator [Corynebacterium glyciniphilum]|uniref:LysR family transcriptional regulator n=1 Tax=Corynebacterium glyciniphilum TaxID=1404244 RepID=UPI003DA0D34A